MKLYTGRGDKGMTSLVGGRCIPKTHQRLEAYGTVDELNSFIGLLITEVEDSEIRDLLLIVQSQLFCIGTYLATDQKDRPTESHIREGAIIRIEEAIDVIDRLLPMTKSFVLPGGTRGAAVAHIARAVCRRAERMICRMAKTEIVEASIFVFMNRLSDLLFVIARKECIEKKGEEIFWGNTCK